MVLVVGVVAPEVGVVLEVEGEVVGVVVVVAVPVRCFLLLCSISLGAL